MSDRRGLGQVLEGVGWWDDAFQAAGWAAGTFQIELQPEGVDLMDIDGTHAIQWVHRDFRGWSSGSSVVDPRTGEIIKGHVRLGSLRYYSRGILLALPHCSIGVD